MGIVFEGYYPASGNRLQSIPSVVIPDKPFRLLVGVVAGVCTATNPEDITDMTYDSTSMSVITWITHTYTDWHTRLRVEYYLDPPVGTTSMGISYSPNTRNMDVSAHALVFTGVKNAAPQTVSTYTGIFTTNTLSSIASNINGLLIEAMFLRRDDQTYTPNSGQTEIWETYFKQFVLGVDLVTAYKIAIATTSSLQYSGSTQSSGGHMANCFYSQPLESNKMILIMSSIYDRIQENRKKLGIGDLEGFKRGRNGLWKPQSGLVTI